MLPPANVQEWNITMIVSCVTVDNSCLKVHCADVEENVTEEAEWTIQHSQQPWVGAWKWVLAIEPSRGAEDHRTERRLVAGHPYPALLAGKSWGCGYKD